MYHILEALFLIGAGIILLAGLWFLANLFRSKKRFLYPFLMGMVGIAVILSPVIYTRLVSTVDLGEYERVVDSELHLTLTGWDRGDYGILKTKPNLVVLQMANPDVTDDTVELLQGQTLLRSLDLNDTAVTDRGLTFLTQLKSLTTLKLRGTSITDQGLAELLTNLPNLENLDVRQTKISRAILQDWKAKKAGRRFMR